MYYYTSPSQVLTNFVLFINLGSNAINSFGS